MVGQLVQFLIEDARVDLRLCNLGARIIDPFHMWRLGRAEGRLPRDIGPRTILHFCGGNSVLGRGEMGMVEALIIRAVVLPASAAFLVLQLLIITAVQAGK